MSKRVGQFDCVPCFMNREGWKGATEEEREGHEEPTVGKARFVYQGMGCCKFHLLEGLGKMAQAHASRITQVTPKVVL